MHYQFGLLNLDRTKEAETYNEEWLGPTTLGIEVTSSVFARRCGLGNIDPQHPEGGIGGCSSAIEDALTYPLPPASTKMVTIRPDKDAFGAMAVLMLRKLGKERDIDKMLVSWVGAMDRHGFRDARDMHPELAEHYDGTKTDVMNIICANMLRWSDITTKVEKMAQILCNEMPEKEILEIAALIVRSSEGFPVVMHGNLAVVTAPGNYHRARSWASKFYSLALIIDPEFKTGHNGRLQRRYSIVRHSGVFDRTGCEQALHSAEAKARGITVEKLREEGLAGGGPANIISSPQGFGRDSMLSDEELVAIVRIHQESEIVT